MNKSLFISVLFYPFVNIIYGLLPSDLRASYVKQQIFKVSFMLLSISLQLLIMRILDDSIAKRTIFLSNSLSYRSGLESPSVSNTKSHSAPSTSAISFGNFCNVKYIPLVHLPELVKN
jgi:hypothetical protein